MESIMIENKEYTTIKIPQELLAKGRPTAFVINDSMLAYGVFIIDKRSLKWF